MEQPTPPKVFIDWHTLGYCKFYMTHRCFHGADCKFPHPSPEERARLWRYHLQTQADAARGNLSPQHPPQTSIRSPRIGGSGAYGSSQAHNSELQRYSAYQRRRYSCQPNRERDLTGNWLEAREVNQRSSEVSAMDVPKVSASGDGRNFAFDTGVGYVPRWAQSNPFQSPAHRPFQRNADSASPRPFEGIRVQDHRWDVQTKTIVPGIVTSEVGDSGHTSREIPEPKAHFSTSASLLPTTATGNVPLTAVMGSPKVLWRREGTKPAGPHPGTVRISAQYLSQAAISQLQQSKLSATLDHQERSIAEAREDNIRLQGVTWIDNVRRALQLPIRSYATACVFFHKFRLVHTGSLHGMDYGSAWADACTASLLLSGKVEDTQKKSRDILAAAYNLKTSAHEQLGADDPMFEAHSTKVTALERQVLEASSFDFRTKNPHQLLIKLVKSMPEGEEGEQLRVRDKSWTVLTDLYRTFAPLKQTSSTMALACIELAVHLIAMSTPNNTSSVRDALQAVDLNKWSTSREEIMETLLDLLDLYTQHTAHSILGTQHSLDEFLRIRLALNKECNENNIPRYVTAPVAANRAGHDSLRVSNGHPTPVSPMEPGSQAATNAQTNANFPPTPEGGGTLRFMLDPQRAADEKAQVQKYFFEEWEEYEEEVEVDEPTEDRTTSNRTPDISSRDYPRGRDEPRERERIGNRDREAVERDRPRMRDPERGDHRRFQHDRGPPQPRRFDERSDRRFEDRRYDDDRRRRDERR